MVSLISFRTISRPPMSGFSSQANRLVLCHQHEDDIARERRQHREETARDAAACRFASTGGW